jgi:hypothetical protein
MKVTSSQSKNAIVIGDCSSYYFSEEKSCVTQDSWSLAAPPRVVYTVFYNYYVKLNVATCNKLNVCIEPCNYPFHSVHQVTEYRLCTFKSIKIQLREANIIGIEIMDDRKRNKFL